VKGDKAMKSLTTDQLVDKADSLLQDQRISEAISLYQEASDLYQRAGDTFVAASILMKLGLAAQDDNTFYNLAIKAYEAASHLFMERKNRENYSHAVLSAAFVTEKTGVIPEAINYSCLQRKAMKM
jgi:tetratricopeptide (TPR) repeat protein